MLLRLHTAFLLAIFTVIINLVPMSHYPDYQRVRKAAVAGSFYPATANEINSMIGPWLHPDSEGNAPQALIVPHAGYVYSGEVAASAFNRIPRGHSYKRVFLLGPSHRVAFQGASVNTGCSFAETPLGQVPIDMATGKELIKEGPGVFTYRNDAHDREHCLEVQLPFLQSVFTEVPPVVPIIIGSSHLDVLQEIAELLEPYFTPENLFVISSDFSHYPSYEDARKSDLHMAEAITTGELEGFINALRQVDKMDFRGEDTAACGANAIAILLSMIDAKGPGYYSAEHVMYRNSGDSPYGDKDRVVGYNAIVFTRKEKSADVPEDHVFHFSREEKEGMIATARSAIFSSLQIPFNGDARPVGILKENGYGVFVTLTLNGRLRGCSRPLRRLPPSMSSSSAGTASISSREAIAGRSFPRSPRRRAGILSSSSATAPATRQVSAGTAGRMPTCTLIRPKL